MKKNANRTYESTRQKAEDDWNNADTWGDDRAKARAQAELDKLDVLEAQRPPTKEATMSADDTMAVRCGAWMDVAARWREEHRALRQRASSKHTRERIELRAEASRLAQCIDEIEAIGRAVSSIEKVSYRES